MKTNFQISQYSRFLLRPGYAILVKILKWPKILTSLPFIKKPLVKHVYNRIWSFWLTFTVLEWMKTNFQISQFSRFLVKSGFVILVNIWKWLKLFNSVPFIKTTQGNHVYNWIWSFWLTFTFLQWMKTNFRISQYSRFLLRPGYGILLKMWK